MISELDLPIIGAGGSLIESGLFTDQGDVGSLIIDEVNKEARMIRDELSKMSDLQCLAGHLLRDRDQLKQIDDVIKEVESNTKDAIESQIQCHRIEGRDYIFVRVVTTAGISGVVLIIALVTGIGPAAAVIGAGSSALISYQAGKILQSSTEHMLDKHTPIPAIDSSTRTNCAECKAKFFSYYFWPRHHHCRVCGDVFCDYCSSKTIWIKYTNDLEVPQKSRICNNCHTKASAAAQPLNN